ncbi:MAG TPA: response regulator [Opitutaceae bacterium]|nr:response regulator [Opitutaceae bacterium]
MSQPKPTLLLVEDNEDDVFLMRRALRAANITLPLQLAQDGQEAIDYLDGIGQFADRAQYPLPTLILLDLKLPYIPGLQVLTWIRYREGLKDLPVIVLTSSPEDKDRDKAAELGALSYHVKPPGREVIVELTKALEMLAAPKE